MNSKWVATLILLFQPEDSHGGIDEKYILKPVPIPIEKKSNLSVKALVWTLISILTGLVIGQLC